MNIYEQLTQITKQLENVRETLTHSDEMQVWEVKEYQAVEAGYVAKIAELLECVEEDAATLGTEAFAAGIACAPALDKEVMKAVATLSTPSFTHSKVISGIFKAWTNAWHIENINSLVTS